MQEFSKRVVLIFGLLFFRRLYFILLHCGNKERRGWLASSNTFLKIAQDTLKRKQRFFGG